MISTSERSEKKLSSIFRSCYSSMQSFFHVMREELVLLLKTYQKSTVGCRMTPGKISGIEGEMFTISCVFIVHFMIYFDSLSVSLSL